MIAAIIPPPLWLAVATAGWYAASRMISGPVGDSRRASSIGFVLPFAATCAAAIVLKHPEIAIGVTLAGSVAALTLVLGLIGLTYPVNAVSPARTRWLFLLPSALICLLIGLSGQIRIVHAAVLLAQGLAVLIGAPKVSGDKYPRERASPAWLVICIAVVTTIIASVLAVLAADATSRDLQQGGDGLIAAVMLAPALVLPMIGITSRMASERWSIEAIHLTINVVLVNLCLLLPLSALAWQVRPDVHFTDVTVRFIPSAPPIPPPAPATAPTSEPNDVPATPTRQFTYPLTVWRVDTVLIVVVGLFVLLLGLGRMVLGRAESTVLLLVYVIYLGLSAIVAR